MIKDFKNISNIKLPSNQSDIYGNVDGLSLQNLFYTRNGFFPNCFLFNYEARTNGDYTFDTNKMVKHIVENIGEDVELTTYYTKTLGSKEDALDLGFCIILKNSNIYARIEKSVTESYILYDNNHIEKLEQFIDMVLQFYIAPEGEENTYWRLCSGQGGYYLDRGKIKCPENFDTNKLYNSDFTVEDEKIKKFIEEDDKSGLVLLHGEKGTGKSSYIKHLVNIFPDRKFVYVPASLVNLLGDPSFGSFLITLNNHIIVLEDCENAIKDRRNNATASAVSLLLNMTDGILSDDLGMKFICTFNEDMRDIDPALLRKGRLVSKYEFKGLDPERAMALLSERGIEAQITKPISLAEIFHYGEDGYEIIKKSII